MIGNPCREKAANPLVVVLLTIARFLFIIITGKKMSELTCGFGYPPHGKMAWRPFYFDLGRLSSLNLVFAGLHCSFFFLRS
ncbi:unnamed protein product [Linum trigynum]|uniref:Uncharacterized protein n=1 Tax=Linum trigynum TaxID=586398 RepID=A0AAV2D4W5_9ROSI